jgi:organic radical activating enzyme
MNIALYGAGGKSLWISRVLHHHLPDLRVDYAVEGKMYEKIGQMLSADGENGIGLNTISINTLASFYRSGEVNAVAIPSTYSQVDVKEAFAACLNHGLRRQDVYIVPLSVMQSELDKIPGIFSEICIPFDELVEIYELNIHVTDTCNLNCKRCFHFSSISDDDFFYEPSQFHRDIKTLSNLIHNVHKISLLGGEPLLHKNLQDLIKIARMHFQNAKIVIVTNGILLRETDDALINMIRDNDVQIDVSLYPPLYKRLDDILNFLREKNIRFEITRYDEFHAAFHPLPIFDKYRSQKHCANCRGLRNGRVYTCVAAMYTRYFNKRFGRIFPEDPGIDLYGGLKGMEIARMLDSPVEMCAHCSGIGYDLFPWEPMGKNPEPDDWYIYNACRFQGHQGV